MTPEQITEAFDAIREHRDWSWSLGYGFDRDGEALYNFRIIDREDIEEGSKPKVYWGTAWTADEAVSRAVVMYHKSLRSMG